jgi:factor associated with neutral sphingomyelinase activation
MKCTIKQPLLEQVGIAMLTNYGIYYQHWNGAKGGKPPVFWSINDMVAIARRCDGLKDVGLEIYLAKQEGCESKAMYHSVLLSFESTEFRERIVRIIMSQRKEESLVCYTDRSFVESALQQWQAGQLDNFSYLLLLNSAAGRSFHDLSRYPVFPWVLSNYSEEDEDGMYKSPLDLNNANNYRDLSKPIGALNEERFGEFRKRYDGMVQQQKLGQEQGQKHHRVDAPFMYGTHYSSPGYVLFYLLRVMPEHMLCLQNGEAPLLSLVFITSSFIATSFLSIDSCSPLGKFDVPDRLFHSMELTFQSILANPADVKELIPEFFDPDCFDFLINAMGLQFGNLQSGERVNDVLLPSWAKSAKHFLRLNRAALESDYCTQHLPKWIDMIFGVTSRGTRAKEAQNLFHPICYLRPSDVETMQSEDERKRVELQSNEFGIVPDQLFCREHPQKNDDWESAEGVVMPEYKKF